MAVVCGAVNREAFRDLRSGAGACAVTESATTRWDLTRRQRGLAVTGVFRISELRSKQLVCLRVGVTPAPSGPICVHVAHALGQGRTLRT